jgi:hypothetical protein
MPVDACTHFRSCLTHHRGRAHAHADEGSKYEEKTFSRTFLLQKNDQNKRNSLEGLKSSAWKP